MKALKVLGTILLGWLLLVSLVVLGAAFTLQGTVLNADFAFRQVDKLDLTALAGDVIDEYADGQSVAEEALIKKLAARVVREEEPWFKEQADSAIRAGYDFLFDRTDNLLISVPLAELKQDLKETLWQAIAEDPAAWLPLVQDELNAYINSHLTDLVDVTRDSLPPYLAVLPLQELEPHFQDYLLDIEAQMASSDLPEPASQLLLALARPYFNDFYDQMAIDIPDEISADSGAIPADVMSGLLEAKQYLGYFRTGFYLLIGFAVVLAGGIMLIHRRVRPACLSLGIVFIAAGALELAGVLFAGGALPPDLLAGAPASLSPWVTGLYRDALAVPRNYSVAVLAAGIILLAVSIFYRPNTAAD
jgi:hypothetical protein